VKSFVLFDGLRCWTSHAAEEFDAIELPNVRNCNSMVDVASMRAISSLIRWFTQHPLGTATMLYAMGVFGVLVYAYFEPREQT